MRSWLESIEASEFLLGFLWSLALVFNSLSAVHIYIYDMIYLTLFMGINWTALLTYFQQGFIVQLVEHCTSIIEVTFWNPVEAFFRGYHGNCKDHFHLYSLSAVHTYDLYHLHMISVSIVIDMITDCWSGHKGSNLECHCSFKQFIKKMKIFFFIFLSIKFSQIFLPVV